MVENVEYKTISNIRMSEDCYTELGVIAKRRKIKIQDVITNILEKEMKKNIAIAKKIEDEYLNIEN